MSDAEFEEIKRLVLAGRTSYRTERDLQQLIGRRIASLKPEEEFRLTPQSRLDFFFKERGIVLELKIQGSSGDIFRQVERYSRHESVRGIIIIRHRDPNVPTPLNGKPIRCIEIWQKML